MGVSSTTATKREAPHFRGKCFVFDDRLVVPVNPDDEEPIATCEITGVPCDTYINCANMECNKLFICSEEGARKNRRVLQRSVYAEREEAAF